MQLSSPYRFETNSKESEGPQYAGHLVPGLPAAAGPPRPIFGLETWGRGLRGAQESGRLRAGPQAPGRDGEAGGRRGSEEEIRGQAPAASPPRKCRKGQPREGLLGRKRGGGEKPRRALPPPRRERARTREQSAARAVAMGEGEGSKSPRATGTERKRGGEGRQASEGVRVS